VEVVRRGRPGGEQAEVLQDRVGKTPLGNSTQTSGELNCYDGPLDVICGRGRAV
jgi:hypothetical protein